MKLTEQIQLKYNPHLSHICHLSKNLYNLANYYVRQEYYYLGNWLRYYDLWYILRGEKIYKKLPAQSAQQIIKLLDKNWKSFFQSIKTYQKYPKKYVKAPKPPRYKKKDGEFLVVFTNQQCRIKEGLLYFPKKSQLNSIKTRIKEKLNCVRIIPKGINYILEIVYQKEGKNLSLDKEKLVGIDLGLNNIITMVNNAGLQPAIIKGGMVKSINQFYNKQLARYKSIKDKQGIKSNTKRIHRITQKRNNKINDIFHKISREVINYCIRNDIGTIVIGYNKAWKQGICIGKRNNQNFVHIPFSRLVYHVKYKSELIGIDVILNSESFTSRCSFLDNESIEHHKEYKGKRISRGLYESQEGVIINADVNGAYNILKKAVPKAISADGIEGVGFHPYSITIS